MKIEKVNINDLISPSYNPRTITTEAMEGLKQSLDEFGYIDPIIVNDVNMHIVGGNQRFLALQELGYNEVDVVFIHEPDINREKAINIRLNNSSGEFDNYKLQEILEDLELAEFDIKLTGFDLDDIKPIPNNELYRIEDDGKDHKNNLSKNYIEPPFSVLDTKTKRWQDRKKEWLKITDNLSETRTGEYGELGGGQNNLLKNINEGTSNFDPVLAEIVIKWFGNENTIILDPFGGEQTKGVVAGELNAEYYGCEIRQEQVDLNKEKTSKYPKVNYYCGDSNNINEILPNKDYNLCFTSPPYYDLEVYSNEDMSALGTYEEFMQQYKNIFQKCYDMLIENSFLVVKIGEIRDKTNGVYRSFVPDNVKVFTEIGFKYYNEIILLNSIGTAPLRANVSMKNRKVVKLHQNVLVFYKGDVKNIQEHYPPLNIDLEDIEL